MDTLVTSCDTTMAKKDEENEVLMLLVLIAEALNSDIIDDGEMIIRFKQGETVH